MLVDGIAATCVDRVLIEPAHAARRFGGRHAGHVSFLVEVPPKDRWSPVARRTRSKAPLHERGRPAQGRTVSADGARAVLQPRAPCAGAFLVCRASSSPRTSLEQRERRDMADKPVRADKATAVAELTEQFRNSTATVLTEYRGLTVAAAHRAAALAGRETDVHGRQEHAGQACRDRRGHRPASTICSPVLPRSPSSPATSSRRRRACAISRRPTRCSSSRAASSRARRITAAEVSEARRPRVPRGAAGQAGRRDEGQPEQGRGAVPGAAGQGRPPVAALQDKREKEGADA